MTVLNSIIHFFPQKIHIIICQISRHFKRTKLMMPMSSASSAISDLFRSCSSRMRSILSFNSSMVRPKLLYKQTNLIDCFCSTKYITRSRRCFKTRISSFNSLIDDFFSSTIDCPQRRSKNTTILSFPDILRARYVYLSMITKGMWMFIAFIWLLYLSRLNWKKSPRFSHGTRCAGEVAAARDNGICGVGVAYDSKIAGNNTRPGCTAAVKH